MLHIFIVSMKVVYTDYDNVAVIHECDAPNDDGSCPVQHRQIDVLSRDPEGPREGTLQRMVPVGLQLCVKKHDFRRNLETRLYFLACISYI